MSHSLLIHSLHIYPIKACKGIEAPHLYVGPRGFTSGQIGDRSWILVDKDNRLVSQRNFPQLAKVQVEFITNSQGIAEKIQASCDGFEPIVLDPASVGDEKQNIIIHRGEAIGHKAPDEVSRWFSRFLECDIQVFHQKLEDIRLCNPHFAHNPGVDAVSFADGYPYLVVTTGTLAQLNSFLEQPVLMNRFRPNIVVNAPAETEYSWKHIKIRQASLSLVKPCDRCPVTKVNQETGVPDASQPLVTLAALNFLSEDFRGIRVQGTIFGENAIPQSCDEIHVGDLVEVTETKPKHNFRGKLRVAASL